MVVYLHHENHSDIVRGGVVEVGMAFSETDEHYRKSQLPVQIMKRGEHLDF